MSFNNFKSSLHDLFRKQKNCDVTFSCVDTTSPTGESTIMAHKLVLSVASDVFDTMFYGEATKQEKLKKEEGPISINDIQMPTFKLFLSFIYTKLVDFETPETAVEFYYAAHKYNVIDALEFIKAYMLKEVSSENAVVFYEVGCLYENKELKKACVKIFCNNTMEVLNSPTFLRAEPKTIETIFKLNKLQISTELELVRALERYIDHNKADDCEIAEKVRPALGHIRFLTLEAPLIAQTTLLESADAMSVVGCLSSDASLSKMPSFLSSNKQKRVHTNSDMELIRKLSSVYSDKYCNYCLAGSGNSNHAFWYPAYHSSTGNSIKIENIYKKYSHVWLLDYDFDDVLVVYEVYKSLGWIK